MTPPVLTVTVPSVPMRLGTGAFTPDDPSFGAAWKRNETMVVRVTASEPLAGAPALLSAGVLRDGGMGTFGMAGITPAAASACCGAFLNCACFGFDLQAPLFEAFNGSLTLNAMGADPAGNSGTSAPVGVPVTRWRWSSVAYLPTDYPQVPALDANGNLVVGAQSGNLISGTVVSLSPAGAQNWKVDAGAVTAAIAIGAPDAGLVHVPLRTSAGATVVSLRAATGAVVPAGCGGAFEPWTSTLAAMVVSSVTIAGQTSEQVTSFREDGGTGVLVAHRPLDPFNPCVSGFPLGRAAGSESAVVSLTSQNLLIHLVGQVDQVNAANLITPVVLPTAPSMQPRTLAPVGSGGYGSGSSGVFHFTNAVDWSYPAGFTSLASIGKLAVGSGDVLFFGAAPTSLVRIVGLTAAPTHTQPVTGAIVGTPTLGAGQRVYAATASGALYAFDALNLNVLWTHSFGTEAFFVSPALDCARSPFGGVVAGPGVLYLSGASNGRVYAVIVDSHGLDALAPWPKFQRGARNHGDPGAPVVDVGCP